MLCHNRAKDFQHPSNRKSPKCACDKIKYATREQQKCTKCEEQNETETTSAKKLTPKWGKKNYGLDEAKRR